MTRKQLGFAGLLAAAVAANVQVFAPARANIFKKAEHAVTDGAKMAGGAVEKEATKDAKAVGSAVSKEATKDAQAVKRTFSDDEMRSLSATVKRNYDKDVGKTRAAFDTAIDDAKKLYTEAETAALRAAADRYVKRYGGFLAKFAVNIQALEQDPVAQATLKQVLQAATEKRLDAKTRADVETLGRRLGLIEGEPNSIVPGNGGGLFKSSFGIALAGMADMQFGGITYTVGVLGNCYKEPGKSYGVAHFQEAGAIGGYFNSPTAVGLTRGVVFLWQPAAADEAGGAEVGLLATLGVPGAPAVTLGLQWRAVDLQPISSHFKMPHGSDAAIPGFFVGLGSAGAGNSGGGVLAGLLAVVQ